MCSIWNNDFVFLSGLANSNWTWPPLQHCRAQQRWGIELPLSPPIYTGEPVVVYTLGTRLIMPYIFYTGRPYPRQDKRWVIQVVVYIGKGHYHIHYALIIRNWVGGVSCPNPASYEEWVQAWILRLVEVTKPCDCQCRITNLLWIFISLHGMAIHIVPNKCLSAIWLVILHFWN